jgi:hypothetical protein
MRKTIAVSLTLACILFVSMPLAALAVCSSEDRIELAEEGYSEAQINAQCSSGTNAFAPPPDFGLGTVCVTQWGSCSLPQPSWRGHGCSCTTSDGNEIPGLVQ